MATEATSKAVYYRRAEFNPPQSKTLQQLVSTALGTQRKIRDRIEALDAAAKELRVIGSFKDVSGFLCGRLAIFERGRYQIVMNDDMDANTIPLDSTEPPKKAGQQQQFVEGVLYFAIRANHVAIVQSSVLRSSSLEGHLSWLIRDKTDLIPGSAGMVLKDEPAKATKERIRKSHVKSVVIGRPLMEEAPDNSSKTKKDGKPRTVFTPLPISLDLLRPLLSGEQFERLGLDDTVWDGNLEMFLEIRFPKYTRAKSPDSIKLLDNIGIALRDVDATETKLELADGSTVKGKDLRIGSRVEVETSAQGIIDEPDMYTQLRAWVLHLIQNDLISAD